LFGFMLSRSLRSLNVVQRRTLAVPVAGLPEDRYRIPTRCDRLNNLPFPDQWAHRPKYVIVVDQIRDWRPDLPPSLAELLQAGLARTREPELDLEAEP
jgi:hypothetical protein